MGDTASILSTFTKKGSSRSALTSKGSTGKDYTQRKRDLYYREQAIQQNPRMQAKAAQIKALPGRGHQKTKLMRELEQIMAKDLEATDQYWTISAWKSVSDKKKRGASGPTATGSMSCWAAGRIQTRL